MRGASLFEFGVVIAVVAVLMSVLLSRVGETAAMAQRARLHMAVEQVRLQGQMLPLRCGTGFDTACWQRWLADRRAAPGQEHRPEVPTTLPPADALGLLRVVAQAAGLLSQDAGGNADWQLQTLPGPKLQVALRARPECRFTMERDAASGWVVAATWTDC